MLETNGLELFNKFWKNLEKDLKYEIVFLYLCKTAILIYTQLKIKKYIFLDSLMWWTYDMNQMNSLFI